MKINKKFIKKSLLYIVILFLLIEIIKIRPINNNYKNIKEKYENYEKQEEEKLEKEIEAFSKQQNKLKENLNNYFKDLKIKKINFADKSYSKILYENSSYLDNLNKVNLHARNFKNLEDAKKKYINSSLLNITFEEKKAFIWFINNLLKNIKKNNIVYNFLKYYLFNNENKYKIIIAKGALWLEYGMPHTHNNCIILTQEWFDNITKKYKKKLVNSVLLNEAMTFIHETIHIHQRANITKYEKLYKKWGFIKPKYIHNINRYIYMNRFNPDGVKLDWIWNKNNKYYLIGAIFDSEKPSSLLSVSYKIKELNKTDNNIFNYASNNIDNNTKLLLSSDLFMDYFGISNNHYHPNEITSQYMEYYLSDILGDRIFNNEYEGYNIFKNNINNILSL